MNVYDWDKTIFDGDSTVGMVLYAYGHRPLTLLSVPRTAVFGLLYGLHIVQKLTFKQNLYHMFVFIKDMDFFVEEYTGSHMHKVKAWYLQQQRADDVVISASPQFLIDSFCRRLGIGCVMASPVDERTGRYDGLNCHGEEKVRRYKEVFHDQKIDEFYSDSRSDAPLAGLAEKAWLVKGNERIPW